MTTNYIIVKVINGDYVNAETKDFINFSDCFDELMKYQANHILKQKGLKLITEISPFGFMKVTKMKRGTEDTIDEIYYYFYIELETIK